MGSDPGRQWLRALGLVYSQAARTGRRKGEQGAPGHAGLRLGRVRGSSGPARLSLGVNPPRAGLQISARFLLAERGGFGKGLGAVGDRHGGR